ncbi:TPA: 6-carboxytetrahydropterin synthase QueD, partial [Candidatus Micrarchaeota archaeon]|nr:6-carboxytetrahydropterin synthase QueD [Candidatus Micrarchaeota archaeon]
KGTNRRLYEIQIWETEENGVIYRGEKLERCSK